MSDKEILLELLKKHLGDKLNKIEKKFQEEIDSLKSIKTAFDGFEKSIGEIIKLREDKIKKDKMEENKKISKISSEDPKKKKLKDTTVKSGRKSLVNSMGSGNDGLQKKNSKAINGEKNVLAKKMMKGNKSSVILTKKNNLKDNKIHTRLKTETNDISMNNSNISLGRITITSKEQSLKNGIKKIGGRESFLDSGRNTVGSRRSSQFSKSVGKSNNKPSLHKKVVVSKKKEKENDREKDLEAMQELLNKISIKENEIPSKKDELKKEPKTETISPSLLSFVENGLLEKNISPYLSLKDQICLYSCNKTLAPLAIDIFQNKISYYKKLFDIFIGESIDDKIKILSSKYSQEELNSPLKKFEMSRGCSKAIALLDEELYLRVFSRPVTDKILDEIYIVYKLFCQLMKKKELVNISDKRIFWDNFSRFILENKGEKLSQFCLKCIENFNFENENVLKLKEIAKDWNDKLKPAYYGKICGTTGLIVFLVKDSLEYCGAVEDKKTPPSRIKKNLEYQKTLFDDVNKFIQFLKRLSNSDKYKEKDKKNNENNEEIKQEKK